MSVKSVPVEELTVDDVVRILEIYDGVGGTVPRNEEGEFLHMADPRKIYDRLEEAVADSGQGINHARFMLNDGFRFGSKYTPHSKLVFYVSPHGELEPRFRINMDRDFSLYDEARKASEEFERKVNRYFSERF